MMARATVPRPARAPPDAFQTARFQEFEAVTEPVFAHQPTPPSAAEPAPPLNPARKKLDLSRVSPPEALEAVRIEELTIDGICGVY